jgi:alpha-ribazole phosphatase
MSEDNRLWLIRHAPVTGSRGVIHDADAPADTSDDLAFAALRAKLPAEAAQFASPSLRTLQTAAALGLRPTAEPNFREQNFGDWTGRRHDDLARELGAAYRDFWRAPANSKLPGGESFADQIVRVRDGLARLPAGDVVLVVHSGTICHRARDSAGTSVALRDRSVVADPDRSADERLARCLRQPLKRLVYRTALLLGGTDAKDICYRHRRR